MVRILQEKEAIILMDDLSIYLLKDLFKNLLRGQRSLISCGLTDFMVCKMGVYGM